MAKTEAEKVANAGMSDKDYIWVSFVITIAFFVVGILFYCLVEDMEFMDAVYFCITTVTTVGYGDLTPKTDHGKWFTIFYILIGLCLIGTALGILTGYVMDAQGCPPQSKLLTLTLSHCGTPC